jgi:uncharacterized protein YecE (DUF72 family)
MQYYIGCSGFSYKEWKGIFYPDGLPQSKWFEYYASRFNSLELNVTFYRFPQVAMLRGWFDKSPADFLFAVKAPRLITHYKRFNDCGSLLLDFYSTIREGLGSKLGPVLFQLPRQLVYDEALLERIVRSLDPHFINAVEFRDAGWWQPGVEKILSEHHIIFCGISHPALPDSFMHNVPDVYYRYHGVPRLYYSAYSKTEMQSMAKKLRASSIRHAYIYFNNTAGGAAVKNAEALRKLLDQDG